MPPKPVKRWLILTLLVLLVHLALLRAVPIRLDPQAELAEVTQTFNTRSVEPAPDHVTPVVAAQRGPSPPRSRAPGATRRMPAPVHQSAEPVIEARASEGAAPAEPASTQDTPAPEPEPAQAEATPATATAPETPAATPPPPTEEALQIDADKLSPSRRLVYTLKTNRFPFSLNATLSWRNLGDRYDARLRYNAFGLERVQTSRGQIGASGLAPERFSDKYRGELAAHFNTAQGTISFSANTPDAPLLPGAQDRLSVLMQLGALLASQPERYVPGTTLTVQTAGPRAADVWLFTVLLTESLDLPGGTLQAVKLERKPREPFDQKVEVWLAPQLDYLPARIRITETNGDSADQLWTATESAAGPN
jgi:hypothetical protein